MTRKVWVRGRFAAAGLGLMAGLAGVANAAEVTLQMRGGEFSVKGDLRSFDGTRYVIESKVFGSMTLDAARFECVGADCPKAPTAQAAPTTVVAAGTNLGSATWMGGSAQGTSVMPKLIQAYAQSIGASVVRSVAADTRNLEFKLTDQGGREIGQFNVQRQGVPAGLTGLEQKTVDAVWSARPVSAEEAQKAAAAGLGNLRAPGNENVYALNGMVALVSPENPAVSISIDNLARVYAGQVKDWSELGLPPGKITVYAMVTTSGYWGAFEDLVLRPRALTAAADIVRVDNATDWSDKVAQDRNGIGITTIGMVRNAKALNIEATCGLITRPSNFSAKTEEYPLTHRLHLYTSGAPRTPLARDLLAFAMSPRMQPVLRDANFVDQAPDSLGFEDQGSRIAYALNAQQEDFNLEMMRTLITEIKGAQRLSITYRFGIGDANLDARAAADVNRLRDLLQTPEYQNKTVMLIGFADSVGNFQNNLRLSERRVQTVQRALLAALPPAARARIQTRAYSELAPVACNDTVDARAFNRRVEVWVRD